MLQGFDEGSCATSRDLRILSEEAKPSSGPGQINQPQALARQPAQADVGIDAWNRKRHHGRARTWKGLRPGKDRREWMQPHLCMG